MDLTWTAAEERVPRRVPRLARGERARAAAAVGRHPEGFARHLEWERALFDARWAVVSWPEAYGGRDASLWEWLIFEEEYYRAGGPQRVTQNGIFLLAPTRLRVRHAGAAGPLPPARWRAATDLWCQGWSEPNAGSDLAGIQSRGRARRRGRRLAAQRARRPGRPAARSARTSSACSAPTPTAERHRGLTYFLVPLDAPGVTVRGFGRLDGDEGFAEVFFDDVFVPDDRRARRASTRAGAVAMATTGSERGLTLRSPGRFLADRRRASSSSTASTATRRDDPTLRDDVVAGVHRRRGVPAADVPHRHAHDRRRERRRGVEPHQGLLVRARRAPPRDRARAARPRRRARRQRRG